MIKIKLKSYSNPLEEGRVDDMKKKYPNKDDLIDQFSKAPGNNKYLDWMMRHHEETTPDEMLNAIQKFDKYISQVKQKDINSYSSFQEFIDTVEDLQAPKKELEREGTLKIYEDEEFSIYRPINQEASCKLGIGTKWCIAATKSTNYFGRYAKGGAVHYLLTIKNLPKEDPRHLVAYTFIKSSFEDDSSKLEIYDSEDKLINRNNVVDAINDVGNLAESLIFEDDFEDDMADYYQSQNSAEEKEEKLYGIMQDDLAKNIPSKIPEDHKEIMYDQIKKMTDREDIDDSQKLYYIADSIYTIFIDEDSEINKDPKFIRKHFRRLINLNNPFVNEYFKRAFITGGRGDPIAALINSSLPPEYKSRLAANIRKSDDEDVFKDKKVQELIDLLKKDDPDFSRNYNSPDTFRNIRKEYPTYPDSVTRRAIDAIRAEQNKSVNESKLFSFNKDKKIFKLAR